MGKRSKQKEELRKKILKGASDVFEKEGFENCTMKDIAEKAGVGLGTAYNYFKSKEDIFLVTLAGRVEESTDNLTEKLDSNESGIDKICSEIISQISKLKLIPKPVLKKVFAIIFKSTGKNDPIVNRLVQADLKMMKKIADMIDQLLKNGKLKIDAEAGFLSEIIYGTLFFHLIMFLNEEDQKFDDMCNAICEKIHHILQPKKNKLDTDRGNL